MKKRLWLLYNLSEAIEDVSDDSIFGVIRTGYYSKGFGRMKGIYIDFNEKEMSIDKCRVMLIDKKISMEKENILYSIDIIEKLTAMKQ